MALIALGEKLKELRLRENLTQDELLEKFAISQSAYSLYESGKRRPSYELLLKFAIFYDVSTDYLLGRIPTYYPTERTRVDMSYGKVDLIHTIIEMKDRFCPQVKKYIKFLDFEQTDEADEEKQYEGKKIALAI